MAASTRFVWPGAAIAVGAAVFALHTGGYLDRFDNAVGDARARLLAHETESDIVIVGIDSESLRRLSEWPWPRRHHARLLQHLNGAAPGKVFLDIDFSSLGSAEDDALLEKALAEWQWAPIQLAVHIQSLDGGDGRPRVARPLERFARHARLASVMLAQSPDGLLRAMPAVWSVDADVLEPVFADEPAAQSAAGEIDFSILPSSFDYVSYAALLNGEIEAAALRGKTVYVGSTAGELGDTLPVPVHGSLPGVVVQALATETARMGPIVAPARWLYAALLALWIVGCWKALGEHWRRNLGIFAAGSAALAAANVYLFAVHRLDLDVVAFAAALSILFVTATLRSLDTQTWRALALAVGFRRRDALLKSVVESTTDAILCVDGDGAIRTVNPAAARLFGRPTEALVGAAIDAFIPEIGAHGRGLGASTSALFECTGRAADGAKRLPLEVSVSRIALDEERLFTIIARDVSERAAQRAKLEHQATHDPLTGLPNRLALATRLEALLSAAMPDRRIALLLLDLGRFKEVNDTLGHDVGDSVLREVAGRFAATIGERGMISRIGGDEFTVVMAGVTDRAAVDTLARALIESSTVPIHVRGIAIEIGLNIGVALAPDHAGDAKELLRNADIAMYAAKSRGTAVEYYDRSHDGHTVRRLSMLSELRAAIEHDRLSLFFQPQIALQARAAQSVEALVRWAHPLLGDVAPDEFIPLAESTNLIRPLTQWTIARALRQSVDWRRQGQDLRVAVNLSPRLLQDVTFPALLAGVLAEADVEPGRLELEITENAMVADPRRAMRVIKQIHSLGVLISIDDYGTGFSSLGYLRDLPAHALKLDKTFVIGLETHESNRVIVESTLHMAHALGLQIVAEGVESQWVAEHLTRLGYDYAQGYWYARSLPAGACAQWIGAFNADAGATARVQVGSRG